MSPREGRPVVGWRLLAGRGSGASAALALLVLVTVFVAVVLPRASVSLRSRALHQVLAGLPASADAVTAVIGYGDYEGVACGADTSCVQTIAGQLSRTRRQLAGFLTRSGVPLRPGAAWTGLLSTSLPVTAAARSSYVDDAPPQFQLGYSDELNRYAALVSGRWPAEVTAHGSAVTFELAVTTATASRFGLHPGSRLRIGAADSVVITGVIRPVSHASAFWSQFTSLSAPAVIATSTGGYWLGGGFVGPGEALALADPRLTETTVSWVFPLALGQVSASQAGHLLTVLTAAASQGPAQVESLAGSGASFALSSGATSALGTFVTAQATAGGIVSLLFVSLAVLSVLVVLLAAELAAHSRRDEWAIMLARGATRRQVGWLAVRGNALVTLPAALVAACLAVGVTPGGSSAQAWWLAGLIITAALVAPAWLAARPAPSRAAGGRLAGLRRVVIEVTLTGLAVAGLVLVRQQGLPVDGSANLLASAAPVLVAVPAAVAVIRLWPAAIGLLLRLARRNSGVVTFVGLARGADRANRALLPVFALVLALAVVAFGGAIAGGIAGGEASAAWQQTGADAVVGSPSGTTSLTAAAQRAITAVRGVQLAAAIIEESGQTGSLGAGTPFDVAVVSPRQYAAVLASTPGPPFPAAALARRSGPLPVIASPSAASLLREAGDVVTIGLQTVKVTVAGQVASTPAAQPGTPFLIVPMWAAGPRPLPPTMMLLAGPLINAEQLTGVVARTAPGATVMVRSVVAAQLAGAPLPRATLLVYVAGSAAAAAFSLLIIAIVLLLGRRGRQFTDARLHTMGVSQAQARGVGILEVTPLVLAAAVGGIGAAAVLALLLGPVISLAPLTGGTANPPLSAGAAPAAVAAAALVTLALAMLAGQAWLSRDGKLGVALRASDTETEGSRR